MFRPFWGLTWGSGAAFWALWWPWLAAARFTARAALILNQHGSLWAETCQVWAILWPLAVGQKPETFSWRRLTVAKDRLESFKSTCDRLCNLWGPFWNRFGTFLLLFFLFSEILPRSCETSGEQ